MFDAIFFDNDGILVETDHLFFRACSETLKKLVDFDLPYELYREHILVQGVGFHEFLKTRGCDIEISDLRRMRTERYFELLRNSEISVFPGVRETLSKLSKKIPLGVVTAAQKKEFEIIHEKLDLRKYFDFVVDRDDVEFSKPHPEGYLLAAKKAEVPPKKCLVIEDSPRGISAAKNAGMMCWCVPTKNTREMDLSQADKIFEKMPEILKELEKN